MTDLETRDESYWADRRLFRRFDTQLACSLRDAVEPALTAVMMRNLSLGGCFVLTPRPLVEGSVLELNLVLPELDRSVLLSGIVAWQKLGGAGAGMGVRFTSVATDDLDLLRIYLRELAKESELEA